MYYFIREASSRYDKLNERRVSLGSERIEKSPTDWLQCIGEFEIVMFASCASRVAALIGARYLSAQRAALKRRGGISLADGRSHTN